MAWENAERNNTTWIRASEPEATPTIWGVLLRAIAPGCIADPQTSARCPVPNQHFRALRRLPMHSLGGLAHAS